MYYSEMNNFSQGQAIKGWDYVSRSEQRKGTFMDGQ